MSRHRTVLPSARRLMVSLRDIGYDFPSAVADLVDNSIDACARRIEVTVEVAGSRSWIRVADDGLGMTASRLDEAMRYGSDRPYDDRALGQFGLGLKTASLSQCRRLTVASRSGKHGRVHVRRWDLDHVLERDSWELEVVPTGQRPEKVTAPLQGRAGTVVLWEKLDRVLAFRNPDGGAAERFLSTLAAEIASHLGMVFHRFISGEESGGNRPVAILVDGEPVEPWDPFSRDEPDTRILPLQVIPLPLNNGATAELHVQPYVLPAQTRFSSAEAHQRAAGPNRWNRQQGLYIYRRDRLIQSGGWNRLRTFDEHAKLARIAVDLPLGREELFGINVAKMSVSLPEAARPPLRAIASAVVQEAQRSYREHLDPDPPDVAPPAGGPEPIRRDGSGPSISGDWPLILAAVERELEGSPELRDRVLLRLANAFG